MMADDDSVAMMIPASTTIEIKPEQHDPDETQQQPQPEEVKVDEKIQSPSNNATNKRKLETNEENDDGEPLSTSQPQLTPKSPPKRMNGGGGKETTNSSLLICPLGDERTASELQTKLSHDLVSHLATNKLNQLKHLHSECINLIAEELYLTKGLNYADYTTWQAPKHLLNRDRLDYLNLKV